METKIMRVVQQGDVLTVQSPKSEGGMLKKRNIILREMGGKFENTYAAVMLGTTAELSFGNQAARPEGAEALSPGHRPGLYNGSQQGAL